MQEKYQDDEVEMDLGELLFELLGHWKMILMSAVIVGAIAFVFSKFLITPQYESTAELYVLSESTSITSLADIQVGSNLTNDYIVVTKGRPVIEQVIDNLGLEDETYHTLKDKITLNNPSDSRILDITVTDPDPARAKKIADEIAEVASAFISEKMKQEPPRITQYGYTDGNPVSPSIPKNVLIGAFLGAFLAMALVIISYLLNDTIMGAEDVEKRLGINLLGSLPLEEDAEEYDGKSRSKSRKKKKKSSGSKQTKKSA